MATGTLTPTPVQTVLDANGNPVAGALINTYLAGTSTRAATYTDVGLLVANANPIVADSAGRYTAFLTPGASYKFVVTTAAAVAVWTADNIGTVPPTNINLDVTGTAGEAITAGQAVYLSDGSGSKTAGSWYKADSAQAYSSIIPEVGIAPASIASAASGTIRLAGQVTGLSSLVVGTTYYVGTAGALTATAPTNNKRILGVADTTASIVVTPNPSLPPVNVELCEGRLTLTTATPITTSDVTAATTLYFTPYKGNRIALYDGTNWSIRAFAELSIAVPATTSQMYDVWVYDNAGTLALELLAWTNDTTRATALALQDGVYAKTGATTRRYVGSVRTTTVSGQTEDSLTKRFVWNYSNRVARPLVRQETTASWTYTTATVRQANGSTSNQLAVVQGVAENFIDVTLAVTAANTNTGVAIQVTIGEDSTTAQVGGSSSGTVTTAIANGNLSMIATIRKLATAGYHTYVWQEFSGATGTTTWFGTTNSGIYGTVWG